MSQNPIVLGFHFLLEVGALAAAAYWGWTSRAGVARWAWAIGLPLVLATAWAIFRAAGDGPDPTVTIPGVARLIIELAILGGAAFLLWRAGRPSLAGVFVALIVIDFALQYDRVGRLLGM
jgi:hypothetical protein